MTPPWMWPSQKVISQPTELNYNYGPLLSFIFITFTLVCKTPVFLLHFKKTQKKKKKKKKEDLCRGGGGGGGGVVYFTIISPLFPNFLPFWYPCIFNGFCYLYIIYKFINRDFSVGELAEPISSQVSRWRLGITLHLQCSSTAWLHLTFAVQVPP